MNLIETLISEVSKRPLLWDRYDNDYKNRTAMESEWETIAAILEKDKDYIKNKWRNLRDQFQREIKKVKVPFDNPTKPYIKYYRGKWLYFEQMLFLKDGTQSRRVSSNCHSPLEMVLREDEIKEEIILFEDGSDDPVNNYNYESDNYEKISLTSEAEEKILLTQPKVEMMEDEHLQRNQADDNIMRKRKILEPMDASMGTVKSQKLSVVDKSTNTTHSNSEVIEDDDLHFVKSLVPYFKKLTPVRKLLVRNEIHHLLIRESLCEKCKVSQ